MIKFKNMRCIVFCMITTFALAMALTACGNKKDSPEHRGRPKPSKSFRMLSRNLQKQLRLVRCKD